MLVSFRSNERFSIFSWLEVLPIYRNFIFCLFKEVYNRRTKFWSILRFYSASAIAPCSLWESVRSFGFVASWTTDNFALLFENESCYLFLCPCFARLPLLCLPRARGFTSRSSLHFRSPHVSFSKNKFFLLDQVFLASCIFFEDL